MESMPEIPKLRRQYNIYNYFAGAKRALEEKKKIQIKYSRGSEFNRYRIDWTLYAIPADLASLASLAGLAGPANPTSPASPAGSAGSAENSENRVDFIRTSVELFDGEIIKEETDDCGIYYDNGKIKYKPMC